jgi:hypothetical protein
MRQEVVITVRYNNRLRREVVMRLTYVVGEGHRPDIVRWFLLSAEVENIQ